MFLALMLAAATASAAKAPAQAVSMDMVPPFISACMSPGPEPDKIKAAVIKGGGVQAPQAPGSKPPAEGLQAYLFANTPVPFSVIFDISQTEAKPHAPDEKVLVEYRMTSKEKNGGLLITLSSVTREGKGTAMFLTRRIFGK